MRLPRIHAARAFTLIELMVAIALFAGVIAAIYACWSGVLRGSQAALDAAAEVQRGRVAQRAVEDALTTAAMYGGNAGRYAFYGEMEGENGYLSFVARLPESFPGAGMFGDLTVRRVTFRMMPGTNSALDLVMTQAPYLYATNADQEPYSLVLARNVKTFALQFLNTNNVGPLGRGAGEWVDTWPYTNRLPAKVQYALAFDHGHKQPGAAPYVVSGVVAMPSAGVSEVMQRQGRPQ
jgi:type II secretion system protein J